mmetsp:Transcript_13792/g.35556  ORF Transcript_13792/g.35556 Transcript_13792/m.35556 type:complete len:214 (+) Transcript_13792:55-696(+)
MTSLAFNRYIVCKSDTPPPTRVSSHLYFKSHLYYLFIFHSASNWVCLTPTGSPQTPPFGRRGYVLKQEEKHVSVASGSYQKPRTDARRRLAPCPRMQLADSACQEAQNATASSRGARSHASGCLYRWLNCTNTHHPRRIRPTNGYWSLAKWSSAPTGQGVPLAIAPVAPARVARRPRGLSSISVATMPTEFAAARTGCILTGRPTVRLARGRL